MKSDYDKWFICADARFPATKCKRERLIDHLTDLYGATKAAYIFPLFRRATFSEHCQLELKLLED